MRVCDICAGAEPSSEEIVITAEDQRFDLCDKHMLVLMKFLQTRELPVVHKKKRKKRKKISKKNKKKTA